MSLLLKGHNTITQRTLLFDGEKKMFAYVVRLQFKVRLYLKSSYILDQVTGRQEPVLSGEKDLTMFFQESNLLYNLKILI